MSKELDDQYCVTCPKCGRVSQKTYITDSKIKCSRCGYHYYVHMGNGVSVIMEASRMEGGKPQENLLAYVRALESLISVGCAAT